MRVSTGQIFRQGIEAIQLQQTRLVRTQNQIALGTRILSPADDPAGAKRLLDLRQSLALNEQFRVNADTAISRLGLEDSTLAAATNVLQRVREISIQANNATLTETDRGALAAEVEQRLGELVGLANTKDGQNEFLFAGLSSHTRPFGRVAGGAVVYSGDQGGRSLQLGPGFELAVSDSGTAVFEAIRNGNGTFAVADGAGNTGQGVADAGTVTDPGGFVPDVYTIGFPSAASFEVRDGAAALVTAGTFAPGQTIAFLGIELTVSGQPAVGDTFQVSPSVNQDVFATLDGLLAALRTSGSTGADRARVHNGVNRAISAIDQALENFDRIRAGVGARLNAAENERFIAEDFGLQLAASISAVEDLDLAEAISRLTRESASLDAATRSFALVQGLSLFDFI